MKGAASRATILIVENDEEIRRLYADILEPTGAEIIEAGNPYEAFEQLHTRPIDLIVTDIGMPGGGIEYLAKLHRNVPACPIITVTGLGGVGLCYEAIAAGAREFLEKPIRTKQLREAVDRLLP